MNKRLLSTAQSYSISGPRAVTSVEQLGGKLPSRVSVYCFFIHKRFSRKMTFQSCPCSSHAALHKT